MGHKAKSLSSNKLGASLLREAGREAPTLMLDSLTQYSEAVSINHLLSLRDLIPRRDKRENSSTK